MCRKAFWSLEGYSLFVVGFEGCSPYPRMLEKLPSFDFGASCADKGNFDKPVGLISGLH